MFCGLGEKSVQDLGRKKRGKIAKKLVVANNGLVGMNESLIFFVVFKSFLNETAFHANFWGVFRVLKPKSHINWLEIWCKHTTH